MQQGQADRQTGPRARACGLTQASTGTGGPKLICLSCCLLLLALLLPRPARAVEWESYLTEDFNSDSPMFFTGQAGEAQYSVDSDGRYNIDGMETGSDSLSALTDNLYYYYFEADCRVEQSSAGDLAFCGLVFHYHKLDGGKLAYYVFYTYGDGYYGAKRVLGEKVDIILPLSRSSEINIGEANLLSVDAQGSRFDLYINGKYVDGFTDTRVNGGGFGFYTSKHSMSSFDDFLVKVEKRSGGKAEPEHPESVEAGDEAKDFFKGYQPPTIPKDPERPLYPWEVGYDKSQKRKGGKAREAPAESEEGEATPAEGSSAEGPAEGSVKQKPPAKKTGKAAPTEGPATAEDKGGKAPVKKGGKVVAPAGQPKGQVRPPAKAEAGAEGTAPEADEEGQSGAVIEDEDLPADEELVHEPSEHGKAKQARPPRASDKAEDAPEAESGSDGAAADSNGEDEASEPAGDDAFIDEAADGDLALLPADDQAAPDEPSASDDSPGAAADKKAAEDSAATEPAAEPADDAPVEAAAEPEAEGKEPTDDEPDAPKEAEAPPADSAEPAGPPPVTEAAAQVRPPAQKSSSAAAPDSQSAAAAEAEAEQPAAEETDTEETAAGDEPEQTQASAQDKPAASGGSSKKRKGLKIGGDDWDEPAAPVRPAEPARKSEAKPSEAEAQQTEAIKEEPAAVPPEEQPEEQPPAATRGLPRDPTETETQETAAPPDTQEVAQVRPPEPPAPASAEPEKEAAAAPDDQPVDAAPPHADAADSEEPAAETTAEAAEQPHYNEPLVDAEKVQGGAYFGGAEETPLSEILPMLPPEQAQPDSPLSELIHEDASSAGPPDAAAAEGEEAILPTATAAADFLSSPSLTSIADDFSTARWPVSESATCSYRYHDGAYEMDNSRAETMAISYQEDNFSDCETSVSVSSLGGADYVGFGLAGRFMLNGGAVSYYGLFVSRSGEFLLLKVLGGKEYVLADWTPVGPPAAGQAWRLSLEFVGPAIRARVNGELVASIKDGDIPSGGYALLAGPGTSASYDDFALRGVRAE